MKSVWITGPHSVFEATEEEIGLAIDDSFVLEYL